MARKKLAVRPKSEKKAYKPREPKSPPPEFTSAELKQRLVITKDSDGNFIKLRCPCCPNHLFSSIQGAINHFVNAHSDKNDQLRQAVKPMKEYHYLAMIGHVITQEENDTIHRLIRIADRKRIDEAEKANKTIGPLWQGLRKHICVLVPEYVQLQWQASKTDTELMDLVLNARPNEFSSPVARKAAMASGQSISAINSVPGQIANTSGQSIPAMVFAPDQIVEASGQPFSTVGPVPGQVANASGQSVPAMDFASYLAPSSSSYFQEAMQSYEQTEFWPNLGQNDQWGLMSNGQDGTEYLSGDPHIRESSCQYMWSLHMPHVLKRSPFGDIVCPGA